MTSLSALNQRAPSANTTLWQLDRVDRIGGYPTDRIGTPRIVDTDRGRAIAFDGVHDGLMVSGNPIAGLERFTIEIEIAPSVDGPEEQRFLHIEESGSANRALLELRMLPGQRWCLDAYLRYGEANLTLIDRTRTHTAGEWHTAALTFDGHTMSYYVDGQLEGSGPVAFRPLRDGRTSIGVRQNLVSFFKGRARQVRVTSDALQPAELLRVERPSR